MGLQRLGSNGSVPNVAALGHRGALVALGAVGLSLGAAWAWKSTKDNRLLLPVEHAAGNEANCILPAPQKSAGRRRKRQKARPGVEPVPEETAEAAEATGSLCCKASADGTEHALSDTASTDEPVAEAELDVSDDTSFAAAAQQAVGNGAPSTAVWAEAPVGVQPEEDAALATPPAADADGEDWSVVERRRPRRQRAATPEPDATEAGCNTGESGATPSGVGPEEEAVVAAVAAASSADDVEVPEEEAAAAAAASTADDVEMLDAIFAQQLSEEHQASGVMAEATAEPEAGLPPLPDTLAVPAAVGAEGQKKKKSKKKKRPKEEEPVSDESRACSPRADDLPQGLPPPPLHPGDEAPPAEADFTADLPAQESLAAFVRADSPRAAAKGLPPPLPRPAAARAPPPAEVDFTAEEAIAAVARMEREGSSAAGADDGWATVSRRKPRRNGEERPSGESVGTPMS